MKIVEVRHPLVQHKIGLLRDAALSTKAFRELVTELGTLLAYEATADLETSPPRRRAGRRGGHTPHAGAKITMVPICARARACCRAAGADPGGEVSGRLQRTNRICSRRPISNG